MLIDDNEIDNLINQKMIESASITAFIYVHTGARSAIEFLRNMEKLDVADKVLPDVIFLDIDMPFLNGMEFRKKAMNVPVCIFITAHPEHAVESFELDTLDFIVKPIKLDRFNQTMIRIDEYMELKHKAALFEMTLGGDVIYIKEGHEQIKIKLHDILYLEALKDYTKIVTSQKKYCVLSNLGTLLKEPHFASFLRIHRSYAVQKQFVKKILTNEVQLNNEILIPIGRSYKNNLNLS